MTVGELNRRIEVLAFVEERDSFGGVVGKWVGVGRVWAKIEQLKGSEVFSNEQVKCSQPVKMTVRFFAGITTEQRIKHQNKMYEITAVLDENTSHKWTIIQATEVENGEL